jgi:hypothetical protein
MPVNPFEPPQEVNEPSKSRHGQETPTIVRVFFLFLVGAIMAFGIVRLWMASAPWGW